jgi:hypothetical protein
MVTALDLDGNPRVYANGVVDMGAYEYPSSVTFLATDWLAQYGLAADGSEDFSDSDADGFSNWAEWRSGTNPTNDQSFFECRQLEGTMPQGLVIRWPSITDRTYSLERSLNLMANPAFTNIAAGVQGQLGFTSYTDTSATASGSYIYRVKVE